MIKIHGRGAAAAALIAVAVFSQQSVNAQSDYPARPVSLIVPYAAGGVADVGMRILGDKLSDRLKQPFVIVDTADHQHGLAAPVLVKLPAQDKICRGCTLFLIRSGRCGNNAKDGQPKWMPVL